MSLTFGTRLATDEILAALGTGGMGEVCRARDAKLGREIAVSVLLAAEGCTRILRPKAGDCCV
jgi:hypothetical protein